MITYRPSSQQGRPDALSRCSCFAPMEGDVAYDQQHSIFLTLEQLLFRTLHITTVGDLAFFKDIYVSLLLDPLALKFKQSCTDFRPQNGQIKVPDSQTADLEILDPKSLDF
jgi:hypothetical protein